jgi:transposase InsO family protein
MAHLSQQSCEGFGRNRFFRGPDSQLSSFVCIYRSGSPSGRVLHFNVTAHPTSEWTAQQMAEAFPWDSAPRYLLHDRDSIYGDSFRERVRGMGMKEVLTAPRSPWQNPYTERLVGSIRRECLDHMVIFNKGCLRRILKSYFDYYNDVSYCPTFLCG